MGLQHPQELQPHLSTSLEQSPSLAQIRYREGEGFLLGVLGAERQHIKSARALINAESNDAISVVGLYKAFGQI